jgi:hypothetical protein
VNYSDWEENVFAHRAAMMTEIIKMLIAIVPEERSLIECKGFSL